MGTTEKLRALLDGRYPETRDRVRWWLSQPGNEPADDLGAGGAPRARARVGAGARPPRATPRSATRSSTAARARRARSVTAFETLAMGDLSLLVKCGVQFGLFGGAILHLGTERHHERYLRDVASLELPGCFAMTETGHGSNVQALRDDRDLRRRRARSSSIHTPRRRRAQGLHRQRGARRADGRRLRPADRGRRGARRARAARADPRRGRRRRCPACGSRTAAPSSASTASTTAASGSTTCASRARTCSTATRRSSADGTYFSPIENPTKRFFTMLGTLIQGRVSVSGASISASKVALTIAVRRALERRQFGPPGGPGGAAAGLPHAPAAAAARAGHDLRARVRAAAAGRRAATRRSRPTTTDRARRELETLAAGVKAVATWHASETIQSCREACGGAGYLRTSRFAALKADTDVFTTFEGDNTVLLQLVAKNLLTDYRDAFGELDPLGLAQFVAGQALGVLSRAHAAGQARPTRGDLLRARDAARPLPLAPRAPAGERGAAAQARDRRRAATRSRCWSTARTTCSRRRARGSTWWCSSRSRTDPVLDTVRSLYALSRSRPSAATTRSTAGCPARARRPSSRPSTRSAASCGRARGRSSTRSACRRRRSATRAWSRDAVAA